MRRSLFISFSFLSLTIGVTFISAQPVPTIYYMNEELNSVDSTIATYKGIATNENWKKNKERQLKEKLLLNISTRMAMTSQNK